MLLKYFQWSNYSEVTRIATANKKSTNPAGGWITLGIMQTQPQTELELGLGLSLAIILWYVIVTNEPKVGMT